MDYKGLLIEHDDIIRVEYQHPIKQKVIDYLGMVRDHPKNEGMAKSLEVGPCGRLLG